MLFGKWTGTEFKTGSIGSLAMKECEIFGVVAITTGSARAQTTWEQNMSAKEARFSTDAPASVASLLITTPLHSARPGEVG